MSRFFYAVLSNDLVCVVHQSANPRASIPPHPGTPRAFAAKLAPYGGEFVTKKQNVARPVGHLTIEKLLVSGNNLKDYVEKEAEATRLRKRQQRNN